jgi:hypothetical protein
VDVKRAADMYAQGRTLRQIGAELGLTATTVSDQLRRAGVTMRSVGTPAHPASTQQTAILPALRCMHIRSRGPTGRAYLSRGLSSVMCGPAGPRVDDTHAEGSEIVKPTQFTSA